MTIFGIFQGQDNPPLVPHLPQYDAQFTNKWQTLKPLISQQGIDPNVAQSIYAMDRTRLTTGQAPLSSPDTARALLSANQGYTTTPSPSRSIWNFPGNAIHDITNISQSLFRLPQMAVQELQALPDVPSEASQAISNASNPFQAITNLSQVHGIRMIPGAFDVGQLARGPAGWKELATHPVMAALDALPGASKLAEATDVARAADEAYQLTKVINPETNFPTQPDITSPYSATPRPIKAVLLNKLNDQGLLTRNAFGNLIDTLGISDAGNWTRAAFSPMARAASTVNSYWNAALQQALIPGLDTPARFRAVQALVDISRESRTLTTDFPEMADPALDAEGKTWTVRTHDQMSVGDWANLDSRQLAYAGRVRDLGERYKNFSASVGWTADVNGETYPIDVANRLVAANTTASWARDMATIREHMMNPTLAPYDYVDLARGELNDSTLSGALRRRRATAYLRAAEGAGLDLGDVMDRLRRTPLDQHSTFNIPDDLTISPRPPIANLISDLQRYRQWTRVGQLKQQLADGSWGGAKTTIRDILNQKTQPPGIADYLPTLDHLTMRDRLANSTVEDGFGNFTDAHATAAEAAAEKLAMETAPARFAPMIEQAAYQRVVSSLTEPSEIARVMSALVNHDYASIADILPGGKSELSGYAEEISKTWQSLRHFDPVFIHRVAPETLESSRYARISEIPRIPSAIKERTWDFAPYVHNASVAMQQQGLEFLQRWGSEQYVSEMIGRFGRTRADVEALVRERALQLSLTGDPQYANYETTVANLMKKEWTGFDPLSNGYFWPSQKIKDIAAGDYMLPRHIADNMERWHNPKTTIVKGALDPVMNIFRTALLTLSPSWYIHQIVGGGVALGGEAPGAFKFFSEARDMLNGKRPQPEELQLSRRADTRLYQEVQGMEGRSMSRWLQEAESSRLNKLGMTIEKPGDLMAVARDTLGKIRDKSYTFSGAIHDTYRSMAYLAGEDKALHAGLSPEEASAAGVELANKILPHFAELTPIERSVMRYIFPFYGWMNYLARYALRYPFDHPVRMSLMAGITRNALLDLHEDGLPESFLTANFFGHKRADGSQLAWRTNAVNPFSSLASRFTLVGLLSQTNPILSSVVEQLGVTQGHLEAYPTLKFDPQTGRLGAVAPGLLQSFAGNLIPQSAIFTALAGWNTTFKDMVRRDPEAATRMIEQAGGIPIPIRTYNVAQEIAKRELAVHSGEILARHTALISGDLNSPYPGLVPLFTHIGELPQSTLAQYQATTAHAASIPTSLSALQSGSLAGRASVGGV